MVALIPRYGCYTSRFYFQILNTIRELTYILNDISKSVSHEYGGEQDLIVINGSLENGSLS